MRPAEPVRSSAGRSLPEVLSDGRRLRAAGSEIECAVGIMAYNEEATIADAIASIRDQSTSGCRISEVIVVASGCVDRTAEIVRSIAAQDARVRLVEQERREGKASAINLFIAAARSEVLMMVSADVVLKRGTLDAMLAHFVEPEVGMVGGHPIPVNGEGSLLGHAVHLQWKLHDRIARVSPKLGEIVAFRNVVPSIPLDTAVDEISIQALITKLGFRLVYVPDAVVYNRGPASVRDFLRQRRRIYAGHVQIRKQQKYAAPTMSSWQILRALRGCGAFATPRACLWSIGTIALECFARVLGRWDALRRRPLHVWEIAATTKREVAAGAAGAAHQNVAVFSILDFHREQLELGVRAIRQITRSMADHLKKEVGPRSIVSILESGTFFLVLPGEREEAERTAAELAQRLESMPLVARRDAQATGVSLAYAVITFSPTEPPVAESIPIRAALEPAGAAASVV
jgi:glycosyltransferase involved in cell wall biosynthesis